MPYRMLLEPRTLTLRHLRLGHAQGISLPKQAAVQKGSLNNFIWLVTGPCQDRSACHHHKLRHITTPPQLFLGGAIVPP